MFLIESSMIQIKQSLANLLLNNIKLRLHQIRMMFMLDFPNKIINILVIILVQLTHTIQ
jgi:hypothetical protein